MELALADLQFFTSSVADWWANRKKGNGDNGSGGTSGMKRVGSSLQSLAKRNSYELPGGNMFVLPDAAAAAFTMSFDGMLQNGGLPAGLPELDGNQFTLPVFVGGAKGPMGQLANGMTAGNGHVPHHQRLADDSNNDNNQGNGNSSKTVVSINVSGKHFETFVSTLMAVEGSYLYKLG